MHDPLLITGQVSSGEPSACHEKLAETETSYTSFMWKSYLGAAIHVHMEEVHLHAAEKLLL